MREPMTPHQTADHLRRIIEVADLWPEAIEQLTRAADLLDTMKEE